MLDRLFIALIEVVTWRNTTLMEAVEKCLDARKNTRSPEAATFNRISVDLFPPKEENKRHVSAIVSISRKKYLSC